MAGAMIHDTEGNVRDTCKYTSITVNHCHHSLSNEFPYYIISDTFLACFCFPEHALLFMFKNNINLPKCIVLSINVFKYTLLVLVYINLLCWAYISINISIHLRGSMLPNILLCVKQPVHA